jgi:CDP-diacylglycerol---serine O-phosphatidyltransferase
MKDLRYIAPNAVTAAALACGLVAVVLAMSGRAQDASWWVLYATLLDRMDGAVARALKASSAMGGQMDSFADFTAFVVAPALVFYGAVAGETVQPLLLLPVLVYVVGGAVRLSRYNIAESSIMYSGVPTTMAGGVFAAGVATAMQYGVEPAEHPLIFGLTLGIFGLLMNCPWLHYPRVGAQASRLLQVIVLSLVAIAAVCIVSRRLPEVVFGITGTAMVFGHLLANDGRRAEERKRSETE